MYRIFCESYDNFLKTFNEDSYRLNIAKPFELIVDSKRFEVEKKMKSDLYKELCEILTYLKENVTRYPKFKAFLWTLASRNIEADDYEIEQRNENKKNNDLEEQAKLINSFLKLAYWY